MPLGPWVLHLILESKPPLNSQLSYIYLPISRLPDHVAGFGTRLILKSGPQIGVVFIQEDNLPSGDINCATNIFFNSLAAGFDRGEIIFSESAQHC